MDYIPINFALLKNPLNWFIVVLMVFLVQIPFALAHAKIHGSGDIVPTP